MLVAVHSRKVIDNYPGMINGFDFDKDGNAIFADPRILSLSLFFTVTSYSRHVLASLLESARSYLQD
jgi:hypothetical protein